MNLKVTPLGNNDFELRVTSRNGASFARMKQFLLQQAGQLAVEKGFDGFEVEDFRQDEQMKLEEIRPNTASAVFADEVGGVVPVQPAYTVERYDRTLSARVRLTRQ